MGRRIIHSPGEMEALGKEIAAGLQPGDVVGLIGDLGTGKTTLTQAIARALGIQQRITSPTFTIVNEYPQGRLPLYHFDVYRLEDPDAIFESGIEEYFDRGGVCILEWADMVAEILPDHAKCVFLDYGDQEGERICTCTF